MIRLFVQGVAELLWPPRSTCLLCDNRLADQNSNPPVCTACWASMTYPPAVDCCENCRRPLTHGQGLCMECAAGPAYGRVWALGLHRGPLREAIHHLKFDGRKTLGSALGERLARQVFAPHDLLVPIPLHPSRLRERGYNQAALIAEGLAEILGVPVVADGLLRMRRTGHQAKLDRADRIRNLVGAFGAKMQSSPPWAGRAVLLVDDVLTTGSTASAAAAVLWGTGARRVGLAVLAVSDKPVTPARTLHRLHQPRG